MPDVKGRDRARYAGKIVAVLGGGHSAVGTLIDLVHLAEESPETRAIWLHRGDSLTRAFGGGDADQLSARGALGTTIARLVRDGLIEAKGGFRLASIERIDGRLLLRADDGFRGDTIIVDELIIATGFRPDLDPLRELRISLDTALECPTALAPLIDPNVHSCGTVRPHGARELAHPEPGFYIAGIKAYGRAPTFLLATGHEQVRSIIAEIAGDHEAALRVELVLPETGVCSVSKPANAGPASTGKVEAGCCGGPAKDDATACCLKDEAAKAEGKTGCGCGVATASMPVAVA